MYGALTMHVRCTYRKPWRAKGLNVPHAYCVLALTEVEGECLIKLRNPNGWGGWNGEWGRDSARWTYDLRQACNPMPSCLQPHVAVPATVCHLG